MRGCIAFLLHVLLVLHCPLLGAKGLVPDQHFPEAGRLAVSGSTGAPFEGIGELAIGITEHFAIGFITSASPTIEAFGFRIRGVLYENEDNTFKLFARFPFLYYPQTSMRSDALRYLTHPVLTGEWMLTSDVRMQAYVGCVAAQRDVLTIWNTLGSGIACPLQRRVVLHAEVHAVLRGFQFASNDSWIGELPIVYSLAFTYNF